MTSPKLLSRSRQRAEAYLVALSLPEIIAAKEYTDSECGEVYRETPLVFPLAFVAHALSKEAFPPNLLAAIQSQLLEGTANYWIRESNQFQEFRLPDDLDDTACVAAGLLRHGVEPSPELFLKTMQIEQKTGGPYFTWYIPRTQKDLARWQDVDPVVNAHFFYLASLYGMSLPKLRKFVIQCLKKHNLKSVYYPSELIFCVYAGRAADVAQDKELVLLLNQELGKYDPIQLTSAELLLWCCAFAQINKTLPSRALAKLLQLQNSDGGLPSIAICHGFDRGKGKQTFVGNPAASTSLFLEILGHLSPAVKKIEVNNSFESLYSDIWEHVSGLIKHTDASSHIRQAEKLQSISLPLLIVLDLESKFQLKLDHKLIKLFCASAATGWLAFSILDNALDEEDWRISKLNTIHQLLLTCTQQAESLSSEFSRFVSKALIETGNYYAWEDANLRLRNLTSWDKVINSPPSFQHVFTRNNIFSSSCQELVRLIGGSDELQAVFAQVVSTIMFLYQLNDDAHDWQVDLQKGILTYPLHLLLQTIQAWGPELEQMYWENVMPRVIEIAKDKYSDSTKLLISSGLDKSLISKALDKSFAPFKTAEKESAAVKLILQKL